MEKKNRYIIGWSMGLQIASTALMIPERSQLSFRAESTRWLWR